LVKLVTGGADNDVNIVKIHHDIISQMRTTDPTLSIKTKDGAIITKDEDFPAGKAYKQQFDMKETKREFIVAHTVYSIKELDDIKRKNPSLLDYLDKANVFLELSINGSLTEILLGPLFGGIHQQEAPRIRPFQVDFRP
jgi:hypothetical protein